MATHLPHRQSSCTVFFLVAVCSLVASYPLQSQSAATMLSDTQANALRYDVVSIRQDKSGNRDGRWRFLPDGFDYSGITLEPLITYAYNLGFGVIDDNQVSGLPGWVGSNYYDIQAKVDAETAEAWKKLSPREISAQQKSMVRSMLADRCQLRAHLETREQPVYDLVIAKGGLKMKEAPADEKPGGTIRGGSFTGHATSIGLLVSDLPEWSGRKVIDKTGLAGKRFDFELQWAPDDRATAANTGPSIFTALQEQLGLKLVPARGPVQVLVIDHMEKPSPN